MTYDASSRKDIRAAEKAVRRVASDRDAFIRAAMSTREGRVWFHHFMHDLHVFSDAPTFEPHRDYFAAGERNVGLRMFSDIMRICPDQYILMEQEENARVAAYHADAERSRSPYVDGGVEGRGNGDYPPDQPDLWGDNEQ